MILAQLPLYRSVSGTAHIKICVVVMFKVRGEKYYKLVNYWGSKRDYVLGGLSSLVQGAIDSYASKLSAMIAFDEKVYKRITTLRYTTNSDAIYSEGEDAPLARDLMLAARVARSQGKDTTLPVYIIAKRRLLEFN